MTRLSDAIRKMVPQWRGAVLTKHERDLAAHLRGNDNLLNALRGIIESRLTARANAPTPSEPIQCLASMACDRELRWLLSRLEFIYRSPVAQLAQEDGEQPA